MNIYRTVFSKNIVCEFAIPPKRSSRKILIFACGLPSVPSKDEWMTEWAKRGYWVFFPRYRGTWESGGEFLKQSPHQDVIDVIDGVYKEFKDIWTGDTFLLNPKIIHLIGTSFGGTAVLLASTDSRVNKVIAVSPVIDWSVDSEVEPLSELYDLLKAGFGHAYRLTKSNWNKLARGHFYNPIKVMSQLDGAKIMIVQAKDDDIVLYEPSITFAHETGCLYLLLSKGGHLSSTLLLSKRFLRRTENFLKD